MLGLPAKFTADMEACAKRIKGFEKAVREKVVAGVRELATDLTGDARDVLVKATDASEAETRRIALRALLLLAPVNKVNELLAATKQALPA